MHEHISIMISKQTFKLAGVLSFAAAIFQAVISLSPSWSLYFGAPEKLVSNIPELYASGLIVTVLFVVFGIYAFSGAGYIRPLPFLRYVLLGIGSMYTLRGLVIFPVLFGITGTAITSDPIPRPWLATSIFSFIIGIMYLVGTFFRWRLLSENANNRCETIT
jgi:hypothetical protein